MGFTRLKYQSDSVGIINIEVSDDVAALVGTEPTAAAVSSLTAYASGSRTRNGIHARGVILSRERGTGADTFTDSRFLPVIAAAELGTAPFAPGETITIATIPWTVQRVVNETAR